MKAISSDQNPSSRFARDESESEEAKGEEDLARGLNNVEEVKDYPINDNIGSNSSSQKSAHNSSILDSESL